MSYTAMVLVAAFWLAIVIPLFVSVGNKLAWLDYLYVLSYVKLGITLVKYVPQVSKNIYLHSIPQLFVHLQVYCSLLYIY